MTTSVTTRVDERAIESAVSVITLAFSADPVARWVYPNAADFYRYFPPFIRAFAGGAFEAGSAYVAEDGAGAALWLPPGVHPDEEAMGAIIAESIPESRRDSLEAFVTVQGELHPKEPHWYLPLIGVDPSRQREGHGSRLLRQALAVCDEGGLPAYLEATTPSSRELYKRHGFEAVNEIRAEGSPTMWGMIRPAGRA